MGDHCELEITRPLSTKLFFFISGKKFVEKRDKLVDRLTIMYNRKQNTEANTRKENALANDIKTL